MTYPIEKKLLSISQKPLINKAFIIAHESGNTMNSGPNALESEIRYMTQQAKKGGPFTSHWVGGGGRIVQLAKTGMIQYGAGRKANPYAFAQVELARTTNKQQFKKDYAAYVWLLQKLAKEAQLPLTLNRGNSIQDKGIKTHHWVSRYLGGTNHSDPDAYFANFGISISQFKKDIEREPSTINSTKIHIVQKEDTLWSLAKKYHTTVQQLKESNHLSSETILTGQIIQVNKLKEKRAPIEITKTIQRIADVKADGIFGPLTKKGILRLFQRSVGVEPDGLFGNQTKEAVRTIKRQSNGWDVYAVYALLFCLKYTSAVPIKLCDDDMVTAIRLFQRKNQLIEDGKCGIKTLEKLFF